VQQWEYLTVTVNSANPPYTYSLEGDPTTRWLNGSTLTKHLGVDGWELTTGVQQGGWTTVLVFRRPIGETTDEMTHRIDAAAARPPVPDSP
jgi:hypothetical protein